MSVPVLLASIDDLADVTLGTVTNVDQANRLLRKATALLRQKAPHVDARIAAFEADPSDPRGLDPVTVATVVAGVVKRVMVNPDGATSDSQTVGIYSRTKTFVFSRGTDPSQVDRGQLAITKADLDQLAPYVPASSHAGSIRLQPSLAPAYGLAAGGVLVPDGMVGYPDDGLEGDIGDQLEVMVDGPVNGPGGVPLEPTGP